jgi:hypothetical protein
MVVSEACQSKAGICYVRYWVHCLKNVTFEPGGGFTSFLVEIVACGELQKSQKNYLKNIKIGFG